MADLTIAVAQSHGEAPHQTGVRIPARHKLRVAGGAGSGNFGHAGRPGEVGGSADQSHIIPSGILEAIQKADGGFTYHAVTGQQPTTGYALSLHQDREQIIEAKDANVVTLAAYAAKNWDLLSQSSNYLGAWHNPEDDKVYLDVSTVVNSRGDAELRGRLARQYAYFDLANGKSVKIEGRRYEHPKTATQFDGAGKWSSDTGRSYRACAALDWTRTYRRRNRLSKAHSRYAGGVGSGNFGHAGRPGEVGGSTSSAQTKSDVFKEWFGDSQVAHRDGSPLVVYHATNANLTQFKPGTHFGTAAAANQRFEDLYGFSKDVVHRDPGQFQVLPVYLSIQNPLRIPDLASLPEDTGDLDPERDEAPESRAWENEGDLTTTLYERGVITQDEFWEYQYKPTEKLFPLLESKGYDGIVYKNAFEDKGSDSWIIFHGNQVKSIANKGTFRKDTDLIAAGGVGSGNFGHAGRPGEVGGSAPSSESTEALDAREAKIRAEAITPEERQYAHEIARAELQLEAELKDGDSKDANTVRGVYTSERLAVHDQILQQYFIDRAKQGDVIPRDLEHPHMIMMAGAPGAGKTTARAELDLKTYVVADSDQMKEYLRPYGYNGDNAIEFQRETSDLSAKLVEFARQNRMNVLIDRANRSAGAVNDPAKVFDGALGQLATFRESGYTTEYRFVSVPLEVSVSRAVKRFIDTGRYVPVSFIRDTMFDKAGASIPEQSFRRSVDTFMGGKPLVDHAWIFDGVTHKSTQLR